PSEIAATLGRLQKRKLGEASSTKVLFSLAVVAVLGCTAAMFTGVGPFSTPKEAIVGLVGIMGDDTASGRMALEGLASEGVTTYHGVPPPYARIPWGDDRVQLANAKRAADPTWEQLKSFLLADETDRKDYDPASFPCGAFAEEIHNNAEAAGIRAAWVVVEFEGEIRRHALNAFSTTDKGLVWIDSTDSWLELPASVKTVGGSESRDKVAYVAIGKDYGLVSLDVASSPAYSYYEQYVQRKLDHRAMREEFYRRAQVQMSYTADYDYSSSSRTALGSTADARGDDRDQGQYEQPERKAHSLAAIRETLDRASSSLGPYWGSLGTVSSIEVYW
ncbi:MAG: hypothetical protein V3R87_03265, partial [Dehalococcoidia bacterium]